MTGDLQILVSPKGPGAYPAISVVSGENPVLLAGVLSPSTEAHDRGVKAIHYRQLATLQEYVFISQTEPRLERYRRQQSGWVLRDIVAWTRCAS